MSFYTSLTGLNAATAQLGVTSNNIANVSTTGFKRSRSDFGDIFATSPLQKASATIGQGVSLKRVVQEFGQGNMIFSSNTLDLAISGDGFFPLKSQDGFQDIFTRNGVFMMNDQYNVVNSAGQRLMAASVDSSGKANLNDMNVLTIPQKTTGMAKQTSKVQLGLNFPADAPVISKEFNRNDPDSYNKSTALTVYDAGGNSYLATVYYVKTQNASQASPNNKWQTYVYVGDNLVNASLQQATTSLGDPLYVNKYGELRAKSAFKTPEEIAELNSSFSKKTIEFRLDNLTDVRTSQPATIIAGVTSSLGTGSNDGINFSSYVDLDKSTLLSYQGSNAASYTFPADLRPKAGSDSLTVGFGASVPQETVSVSFRDNFATTAQDLAKALNLNSNFATSYVAKYDTATQKILVTAVDPTVPSSDIVADLTVSSSVAGASTEMVNSSAARFTFAAPSKPAATGDALTVQFGTSVPQTQVTAAFRTDFATTAQDLVKNLNDNTSFAATYVAEYNNTSQSIVVTAKDATVPSADIVADVTLTSAVSGTDTPIVGAEETMSAVSSVQSSYPKAAAAYAGLTALPAGTSVKVQFGEGKSVLVNSTDVALTQADIVQALNSDTDFSTAYLAKINSAGLLEINARDWSTPDFTTSTTPVTVSTGVANVFTAIDPDAGSVRLGAASAPPAKYIGKSSADDLKNLFNINVDGSLEGVSVGLEHLAGLDIKLSGTQLAAELTNAINRAYGDEKPFDFSSTTGTTFSLQLRPSTGTVPAALNIDLSEAGPMRFEDLVSNVQAQIDASPAYKGKVTAAYDTKLQQLVFTTNGTDKVTIASKQSIIGLTDDLVQGVNDQSVSLSLSPLTSTAPYRATNDQRYGIKVEYDGVKQTFVFKSGTTGDNSSVSITDIRPGSLATQTTKGLGMTGDPASYIVSPSTIDALRGITSKPAVLTGNALAVNVDNNFSVDATNNKFVVSVNGITGTVVVPPKDTYTLGTFMEALQSGINNLQGDAKDGLTPQTVNGVKVSYDSTKNALVFTTGTASTDSYIKVTGDARWGLDGLDAQFGTTTTWIKPTPFTDEKGSVLYIDGFGKETNSATDFDTLPAWSPIYFDKGELTFDTAGNLVSPKQGAQLDTVYLPNGKGALTINIDYSKSTQFASPYAVLSQSQDGAPEGDLVGLAIKDDGLVQASYSNGAQKSLAKIVLVNFSNPSGLRQIGDTNYYKTSDSGTPKYGEAGSAGFGTVRSGATERANVDLTQELVDLITEQRNFQANAKAMETSTSMTQTIIQIRN